MKILETFKGRSIAFKAVTTIVALNLVLIAAALITGIARMTYTVVAEATKSNLALPELLLVVLVASLIAIQYRIFSEYRDEKSISLEEEYFVVAPAGSQEIFTPQLVNAN